MTQITFIIVQNALLANYGWFWLTRLEVLTNFATFENGLKSVINFFCLDLAIASSLRQLTFDPYRAKPLGEWCFRWWTELAFQCFQTALR